MWEFLQFCFSWPTLPASIALSLVMAYWMLVILGAAGTEFFDFDVDFEVDPDGHASILQWGMASMKWLNLGDVPLMVWASAFILPAWTASTILDKNLVDPSTQEIVKACLRYFGIGLVSAKLLTQPLKGKLDFVEPNPADELIDRAITITTATVSPTFGQGQLATNNGAPLLLNIRTINGEIGKGQSARIVGYNPDSRLYFVEPIE